MIRASTYRVPLSIAAALLLAPRHARASAASAPKQTRGNRERGYYLGHTRDEPRKKNRRRATARRARARRLGRGVNPR